MGIVGSDLPSHGGTRVNTPKAKGYVGLMEAAQAAWPEDEAYGTFCTLKERLEVAGDAEETAYDLAAFGRDVEHMRKCFMREPDAEALIVRYDAHLAKLLAECEITRLAGATLPASPFPQLPLQA